MKELRKKVQEVLNNRPPIDWSDTKPPTEHAVYAMIRNLHSAATNSNNRYPQVDTLRKNN